MSSDFYFRKWKCTISALEVLVESDIEYQVVTSNNLLVLLLLVIFLAVYNWNLGDAGFITHRHKTLHESKAHDQTECQAVQRLSRVLGRYIVVYNDAVECLHQNLQVQKTKYLKEIIKAVVSRILELKLELKKLECSSFHFFGKGLVENFLTTDDVEMKQIPELFKRPKNVQSNIDEILNIAKDKREELDNPEVTEEEPQKVHNWWDAVEEEEDKENETDLNDEPEEPEELRKARAMVALIQAHEKSRQTIRLLTHERQKRALWEKELTGNLQPPARSELREKGCSIIQKVIRAYFEIKRQRILNCKRNEMLGINFCATVNKETKIRSEEMLEYRSKISDSYEMEWIKRREIIKEQYLKRKHDLLIEDYSDKIRDWFQEWFERIQYIPDIPKDGSGAIFRGDFPEPDEWLEKYNEFLIEKQANKNKSALQKKFEKLEAKRQQMILKREAKMKKKAEDELLKKIMKNPTMHPGYHYPESKTTEHILQLIETYHKAWDQYEEEETLDVKEKFIDEIEVEDCIMEAKLEVLPMVDELMSHELHKLKTALKEDYLRNEMKMPEQMTKPRRKKKKLKKVRSLFNQEISNKIEELAVKGFIKEYPTTKIEDFVGDSNLAGEDLRCSFKPTYHFHGEVRASWWERCREMIHESHRILIIGPKGGGKTRLVHALASMNNALLFQLDPIEIQGEFLSAVYLQQLVHNVASCAKEVQPSVIHIKHIEKLFYRKVPREEAEMCLDLIKNFFINKLFKLIHKTAKITVVGSCSNPWMTKSTAILKQFPKVLMLPNTNYSIVTQLLQEWVSRYNVIPANFNVSSLAYVLQGYSFGYIKVALEKFMTADRIAHIAAHGLSPMEVYNYIVEDVSETKTEYEKYKKWYTEKTTEGQKEAKHLQSQLEFQLALEKYAQKNKKKEKATGAEETGTDYPSDMCS